MTPEQVDDALRAQLQNPAVRTFIQSLMGNEVVSLQSLQHTKTKG
jgi:hypothetical protein